MDIRKPKPIHNWRAFLGEIGIIVIGVLIALAGEQTVTFFHHRSQVAELSEALNAELSHNLAVMKDTVELKPCLEKRLDEMAIWSQSVAQGHPLKLAGEFERMPGQIFLSAIWRSAGNSLELLPLDKRISYARFYDNFANVDRERDETRDKLRDLATFEGAATLTAHEALQISHDIRDLRRNADLLDANYASVSDRLGASLHIVPEKSGGSAATMAFLKQRRDAFCKSLLTRENGTGGHSD